MGCSLNCVKMKKATPGSEQAAQMHLFLSLLTGCDGQLSQDPASPTFLL